MCRYARAPLSSQYGDGSRREIARVTRPATGNGAPAVNRAALKIAVSNYRASGVPILADSLRALIKYVIGR